MTDSENVARLIERTLTAALCPPSPGAAAAFGLALLWALGDHCRVAAEESGVPVRVCRVTDTGDLHLLAGDAARGPLAHTRLEDVVAALLLREPAAPALGPRRLWLDLDPTQDAATSREVLAREPWRLEIAAHVGLLPATVQAMRAGLPDPAARRLAARALARSLGLRVTVDGEMHVPPEGLAPRTLH